MKDFFIKLDKNFKNLIIMFLALEVMSLAFYGYNIHIIDIIIYDLGFVGFLRYSDKVFESFKKGD